MSLQVYTCIKCGHKCVHMRSSVHACEAHVHSFLWDICETCVCAPTHICAVSHELQCVHLCSWCVYIIYIPMCAWWCVHFDHMPSHVYACVYANEYACHITLNICIKGKYPWFTEHSMLSCSIKSGFFAVAHLWIVHRYIWTEQLGEISPHMCNLFI